MSLEIDLPHLISWISKIQTSTLVKQSKSGVSRAETHRDLGPETCKDLDWAAVLIMNSGIRVHQRI